MFEDTPHWVVEIGQAVVIGAIGIVIGHRVTLGREAATRRHAFRGTIRSVIARIEPGHIINLHKLYQESVPEVRDQCCDVTDDVRFWRRKRFALAWKRYCGFKQSDIVPLPPSAAATSEEMAARKKKHEDAKALLISTLHRIIDYAQ